MLMGAHVAALMYVPASRDNMQARLTGSRYMLMCMDFPHAHKQLRIG